MDPSSGSLDSTIESEGERSFVYGTNDEDKAPFAGGHRVSLLSGQHASLILNAFVHGHYRRKPVQTGGSSDRAKSRHNQRKPVASSSAILGNKGTSTKRLFDTQKNSGDSGDSDDDRSAKLPSRPTSKQDSRQRFFACPYYRSDVRRFSQINMELCYRGCSSACLRDISRLKQHLYRVHRQPEYYCGSCYSVFKE